MDLPSSLIHVEECALRRAALMMMRAGVLGTMICASTSFALARARVRASLTLARLLAWLAGTLNAMLFILGAAQCWDSPTAPFTQCGSSFGVFNNPPAAGVLLYMCSCGESTRVLNILSSTLESRCVCVLHGNVTPHKKSLSSPSTIRVLSWCVICFFRVMHCVC